MRRNPVAGSIAIVLLALAFGVDAEGIARATRGFINLPRLTRRNAADFNWRGAVAEGHTIEVKGVNGDVTAELSPGTDVEVTAERRGRRSNPEDVKLEVLPHHGGVTICAVYPSPDASQPNQCQAGAGGRMQVRNNDVEVRFVVRVPRGVRFAGRTVNGAVAAQGMAGPVALATVNGAATFSTSAYGEASTVNGSIRGSLGQTAWKEPLAFRTVNGSITLDLPADASTDVRAGSVNGEISTDFPIRVVGKVERRRVDGTIGSGGRRMDLDTVNGSVLLRRR